MNKRLSKDLNDLITAGYKVYYDFSEQEKNRIYFLIYCLQPFINLEIIQDKIIHYLIEPLTLNPIIKQNFTIKTNKTLNIKFIIPNDYPFKPPRFTINKIPGFHLKNVVTYNNPEILNDLFRIFQDEWSPVICLINCLNTILLAIDLHQNLPFKSPFLIKCLK